MFLLGGLMFLNFLVFCVVSHYYTYQDPAVFEKTIHVENGDVRNVEKSDSVKVINLRNPSRLEPESSQESSLKRHKVSSA